jgi:tape measure domain-containing protein
MAGSLASINIRFLVDLQGLSRQMQNASREAKKAATQFNEAGSTLTYGLTAAIAGLGVASLKTFGDLEALKRGLTSVMGSAEAADIEFEKLKEVAKLPGLGLEEAARGSVNLQAAGFSADQAREALMAFGNALATVGKGKRELDLVTLALTQLNNKSGGFGQDIRQLTEQLPQLRGALKAAFGTSDSEIISKSGVTGRQVVLALTKEFAKLPKVTGGFNNAVENATDNLKISFAEIGEAINKAFEVEGLLKSVGEAVHGVSESFKQLSPTMQKVILSIAGIAAAIGPVLLGVGGLLRIVPLISSAITALSGTLIFLSANMVAISAAIGIAVIAYTILTEKEVELTYAQKDQAAWQKTLNGVMSDASSSIAQQRLKLEQLVLTARNANESMAVRKNAIEQINKISPEYLGNISLETIRTDAATTAIRKYNEALFKGALARAAQNKIDQNAQKRIEAQLLFEQKTYDYNRKKEEARSQGQAALQKFYKTQNTGQAFALLQYEKKIDLLDKENLKLADVLSKNKDYLGLVTETGKAESETFNLTKTTKAGTIAFYEEQIKKLKELQTEFETTPGAVSALEDRIQSLQAKIDSLNGVKVKVTSVFESIPEKPDTLGQSQGTTDYYDNQIEALRKLQSQVATTSESFYDLEYQIASLELERDIKFDFPIEDLQNVQEGVRVFGENYRKEMKKINEINENLSQGITSALQNFASGTAEMFGEIIGNIAKGGASLGNVFQGLIKLLGEFVSNIGKALIAAAVASIALKVTLSNPYTALAAGIAAIAAGAAIAAASDSFRSDKYAGAYATGGVIGGSSYSGDKLFARVNSGEMILNQEQQHNVWNQLQRPLTSGDLKVSLSGGFEIEGAKLKLVLQRTDENDNRTK